MEETGVSGEYYINNIAERVVEQIVTPRNSLSTEANHNEISRGNNLLYHLLSYVFLYIVRIINFLELF